MAYIDQYALAHDTTFIQRLTVAIVAVALNVQGAPAGSTQALAKTTFAYKVLHDPEYWAKQTATAVCGVATITSASTDQDLYDRYNLIWTSLSTQWTS